MQIESDTNRMPLKLLFLPKPMVVKSGWDICGLKKKFSASIKDLLWNETRLYFVCSLSFRPGESGVDKKGYAMSFDTKLLRGLKPLLALSAIVLKAALGAYGIPLPLPDGVTNMMYVDAVSEYVCERLEDAAQDALGGLIGAAGKGGDAAPPAIDGSLQQVYEMLLR